MTDPTEQGAASPADTHSPTPSGTETEAAGPPPAGEEAVTIDAYNAFVEPEVGEIAQAFFDRVDELSDGLITIEIVADSASIPPFESFDPLARGVVDLAVTSTVYFTDQVPEPMIDMAVTSPEEEAFRQTGALDLFNQVLEEHDVHMLGWTGSGERFHLVGNARLEAADFSGLNVRTFPAINNFVLSLNGSPVTVPFAEVYEALERGVVDLAVSPINSIRQERLYEVSDYLIYPSFLQVRDALLINKGVWDGLSDWKRGILEQAVVEHEKFARANREQAAEESERVALEHAEAVELPEQEGTRLVEAARESTWDFLAETSDRPEVVEQLREALSGLE